MPTIIRNYNLTAREIAQSSFQAQYPSLFNGLVGAWSPCLGYTGNKLIDYSGRKNHGILTNMDPATDWVRTEKGLALDLLSSSSQYISVAGSILVSARCATVAAWIYRGNSSTIQTFGRFTSGSDRFGVLWFSDGTVYNVIGNGVSDTYSYYSLAGVTGWHHIANVYNGTTSALYINGIQRASVSFSQALGASGGDFMLGRGGGGTGYYSTGSFADVAAWSRNLSSGDLLTLYRIGPGGWAQRKNKDIYVGYPPTPIYDFRIIRGRNNKLFYPKNNVIY